MHLLITDHLGPPCYINYAMVACRESGPWGFQIQTHWQNPVPLTKSRPIGKIQSPWLGHKVVHIVTSNIQTLKSCFHKYFIYIHKFNITMA